MAKLLFLGMVAFAAFTLGHAQGTVTYSGPGVCNGCLVRNGIGYTVADSCDSFYHCQFGSDINVIGYTQKFCPIGLYFDANAITCNHKYEVNCTKADNYCVGKPDGTTYKAGGNCSAYVECNSDKQDPKYCPDGESYNVTHNVCSPDDECKVVIDPPPCAYAAVAGSPCNYTETLADGRVFNRVCPVGTDYNETICGCESEYVDLKCKVPPPACRRVVDIDFESLEPGEYGNYGAVIDTVAGTAYFNGSVSIKIPRLANIDFRGKLIIQVSYKIEDASRTLQEAIVANGDCGEPSTIMISRLSGDTDFSVQGNGTATRKSLKVANVGNEFHDVTLTIEPYEEITAEVDGTQNVETFVNQYALGSQCAFQLGHGEGAYDFKGWIQYLIVTQCD